MSQAVPFDPAGLMLEITAEADRRRRSGELPRDFERELDRTFAVFAPVDAVDGDFDIVLTKIERAAEIDTSPPTLSAKPGIATMKKTVAKASGFYVRHIASQVSVLTQSVARALRLLGDRVDALEHQAHGRQAPDWRSLEPAPGATAPVEEWHELVVETMSGATGRVLHIEAGTGSLLARLIDAGVDGYGVEPVEELVLAASNVVPDVRPGSAMAHMRLLPPGSLGGIVLSGLVETLPAGDLVDLVDLVATRLSPGGRVVVISTHPQAWVRSVSPIVVDLALGRPLHPETWQELLAARRFSSIEIHRGGDNSPLCAVEGEGPSWEAMNANVAQLNAVLFGPPAYAVTATSAR